MQSDDYESEEADNKPWKIRFILAGALGGFLMGYILWDPFVASSLGIMAGVIAYSRKFG